MDNGNQRKVQIHVEDPGEGAHSYKNCTTNVRPEGQNPNTFHGISKFQKLPLFTEFVIISIPFSFYFFNYTTDTRLEGPHLNPFQGV